MPVVNQGGGGMPSVSTPSGGREPKRYARANEVSTLEVKHDFVYLAHPLRYDVVLTDRGAEILPSLTYLEFQPGLAGVLPVKGEMSGDPSFAIVNKQNKGWMVVPDDFECVAFGERRRGYRHVYDARGGPDMHHCSVWERPYSVGGQTMVQTDEAGYHQFLRDVAERVLPPMDPNVRRGLEAKLREMHRTSASARTRSYSAENACSMLEKKLKAFDVPEVKPTISGGRAPKAAPKASPGDADA